ncbi:E3 ubiquitin-protein ligase ZNRF2 isoform X1 [Bombina bombina]|uniref:E3 ubiquitin-protein ligase ZNRF2 isoform X1 n=1 Tax=Bombina bombina TaxID=8345 RepID=UPI00235A4F55|nr:E3 ubiquitin-protein ligase ZNRF2 isoform X1 [Bombina bombina]
MCGDPFRCVFGMGGRQSSSTGSDHRTRAYSGSDIPSNIGRGPIRSPAGVVTSSSPHARYHYTPGGHSVATGGLAGGSETPPHMISSRSRSVGASRSQVQLNQGGMSIPGAAQDSGSSTPEEGSRERTGHGGGGSRLLIGSLPSHLSPHLFGGFKCPVCSKFISTDEMDLHLVMCLTKPRITYNEDVLSKDAGECSICLEELQQGDTIARLPCLCIYHKGCIDEWFEVNRSCPEHPSD